MIQAFIEARRRAKVRRDIDTQLAALRLGITIHEREEFDRRRRAGNSLAMAMIIIGGAGFLFAALDPIFNTLGLVIEAMRQLLVHLG
jgi:hypothetical protein